PWRVGTYNGRPQITLDSLPKTIEAPDDLDESLTSSAHALADLEARLAAHIASVEDPRLKALLTEILVTDAKTARPFRELPVACSATPWKSPTSPRPWRTRRTSRACAWSTAISPLPERCSMTSARVRR
ncbi:MAG TPA: hypothetical protein VKT77_00300, partial [Chthonomonadaceae bacterium]|nr:hypothetical protein [Chthonomonadaceae bacterium]